MALVDYNPYQNRVEGVNAMLKRSKVVVLHDSEENGYINKPIDFNQWVTENLKVFKQYLTF